MRNENEATLNQLQQKLFETHSSLMEASEEVKRFLCELTDESSALHVSKVWKVLVKKIAPDQIMVIHIFNDGTESHNNELAILNEDASGISLLDDTPDAVPYEL